MLVAMNWINSWPEVTRKSNDNKKPRKGFFIWLT